MLRESSYDNCPDRGDELSLCTRGRDLHDDVSEPDILLGRGMERFRESFLLQFIECIIAPRRYLVREIQKRNQTFTHGERDIRPLRRDLFFRRATEFRFFRWSENGTHVSPFSFRCSQPREGKRLRRGATSSSRIA